MEISEIIFLTLNTIIAFSILIIATKQRRDSKQGTLVGTIQIIREIQDSEKEKLSNLMELPLRKEWLKSANEDVRKQTYVDLKETLETLKALNKCYNDLINQLDNELDQKGVLVNALRKKQDSNSEETLKIFEKAYKL